MVYSFANYENPYINTDTILGTYLHVDGELNGKRIIYQKKGNPDIKIKYIKDRWKIVNDAQSLILASMAKSDTKRDVCLSDTMHLEWETTTNVNTGEVELNEGINVRHRCKGNMKIISRRNYVLIVHEALSFKPNHACSKSMRCNFGLFHRCLHFKWMG